jgi:hypothetical protein
VEVRRQEEQGAVPEPGVVVTAKVCELFCVMMILHRHFVSLKPENPKKQKSAIAIVGRKCCVIQMMMQCYKPKKQSSTV